MKDNFNFLDFTNLPLKCIGPLIKFETILTFALSYQQEVIKLKH